MHVFEFFPFFKRLQASDLVQNASSSKSVKHFLGMPVANEPSFAISRDLRKAVGRQKGSLLWEYVDSDSVESLSVLYQNEVNFLGSKRSLFNAVKAHSGELVNFGNFVLFTDNDNVVRKFILNLLSFPEF